MEERGTKGGERRTCGREIAGASIDQHLKARVQQGTGAACGMQGGEEQRKNEGKTFKRKDAAGFRRAAIHQQSMRQTIPSMPWTSNASVSTGRSTCRQARCILATLVAQCRNSWHLELFGQIDTDTAVLNAHPAHGPPRSQLDDKHADLENFQHGTYLSRPGHQRAVYAACGCCTCLQVGAIRLSSPRVGTGSFWSILSKSKLVLT